MFRARPHVIAPRYNCLYLLIVFCIDLSFLSILHDNFCVFTTTLLRKILVFPSLLLTVKTVWAKVGPYVYVYVPR